MTAPANNDALPRWPPAEVVSIEDTKLWCEMAQTLIRDLNAALLAAQQERDELREQHVSLNEWYRQLTEDWKVRGDRAERAEAERDEARRELGVYQQIARKLGDRAERAEAALAQDAEQENA